MDYFIDNSPCYLCIQVIYLREILTLSIYSTSLIHNPSYPANGRALGDLHWKFQYQSRNHITYLKSPGSPIKNVKNNSFKYFHPGTSTSLQGWVPQLLGSAASCGEMCRGALINMMEDRSGPGRHLAVQLSLPAVFSAWAGVQHGPLLQRCWTMGCITCKHGSKCTPALRFHPQITNALALELFGKIFRT